MRSSYTNKHQIKCVSVTLNSTENSKLFITTIKIKMIKYSNKTIEVKVIVPILSYFSFI